MDLDEPVNPTPEERAAYERYKRWQDRMRPDPRPRLSQRAFLYAIQLPLTVAGIGCLEWARATRPVRPELILLGSALALLPLLVRHTFRIRRAPDA